MTTPAPISILNTRTQDADPDALTLHPHNPRRGDLDEIKASFRSVGFYGSVIVNEATGYVVAGNHRVMAARSLGMKAIPVTYIHVTPDQENRILLADNKIANLGGQDSEALLRVLRSIEAQPMGLRGTGYTDREVKRVADKVARAHDPVEADAKAKKTTAQAGKIILTLTHAEADALRERLQAYERRTGSQLGFVSEILGLSPPLPSFKPPALA